MRIKERLFFAAETSIWSVTFTVRGLFSYTSRASVCIHPPPSRIAALGVTLHILVVFYRLRGFQSQTGTA